MFMIVENLEGRVTLLSRQPFRRVLLEVLPSAAGPNKSTRISYQPRTTQNE